METTHAAIVESTQMVTPHLVRLGLRLDEPEAWASTGRPDEFVHVEVGATTADLDGHDSRHYTVSALRPDGFELEVFLHGDGPGATWARGARPGDRTAVSDPKAYYEAPAGSGTRVLVGDLTALPAIARILAEARADETFTVIVETSDMADARDLPTAATADVHWRLGGNGVLPSVLREALVEIAAPALDPAACAYVWVACESKDSRTLRQLLRREFALPLTHFRVVGYWHRELERAVRAWDQASEETKAQYAALWRDDRSDEENWVELEPFLQRMGV